MQKQITFFILSAFLISITNTSLWAQEADNNMIEWRPLPSIEIRLDHSLGVENSESTKLSEEKSLNASEKEVLQRINDIYEVHIQSVRAQINDDPLSAEEHITSALEGIQKLLKEYPEIPENERFKELYRTVYTEYKEFYGIEKAENRVNGKVFEVRREFYSSDDNWFKNRFVLPDDITTPKTEVPLVHNKHVKRHLMFYTMKRPEVMESWLERSKKYFPMMKEIFRDEGVPTELVHLSMIESGLNPRARSWASAVGMWQFIRPTGAMYGLEVNWWMDERRDPVKATRAAAQHLRDLYEIWDDWHLAIANYNISPRGLKRAIRAGGGEKDYWSAYAHLPRETQGYIPGFIATTMIDMNAEAFGFKTDYDTEVYSYDVARVAPLMPLDKLAEAAGVTEETIKDYNPELLRWATPPGNKYPLKLPAGTKEKFMANYKEMPKDERSRGVAMHTVRRGETLGHIAQKYGTSVRAIYESNDRLSSVIHPGQKIAVPLAPGSDKKIAASNPGNQSDENSTSRNGKKSKTRSGSSQVIYTVKKGDTIGHIAEWFDVRASQIRAWNSTSNTINIGDKLTMYVPEEKVNHYKRIDDLSWAKKQNRESAEQTGNETEIVEYRVRKNDTLIEIANSFGVSVTDIKKTNNLTGSRIYEGQRLQINTVN